MERTLTDLVGDAEGVELNLAGEEGTGNASSSFESGLFEADIL